MHKLYLIALYEHVIRSSNCMCFSPCSRSEKHETYSITHSTWSPSIQTVAVIYSLSPISQPNSLAIMLNCRFLPHYINGICIEFSLPHVLTWDLESFFVAHPSMRKSMNESCRPLLPISEILLIERGCSPDNIGEEKPQYRALLRMRPHVFRGIV